MIQKSLVLIGAFLLFPLIGFCQGNLKDSRPQQRSSKEFETAQKAFEARKIERASAKKSAQTKDEAEVKDGDGTVTIRKVVGAGAAVPGNQRYRYIEKDKAEKPAKTSKNK
ncbi:MAG: hypothetical protein ACKVTZ_00510 [Bacteroidia bacterium]